MSPRGSALQVIVPAIALLLVTLLLIGLRAIFLAFQKPPDPPPEGMLWIPGGTYEMGSTDFPESQPIHTVGIHGFWMDETEVTNDQFAQFVRAKTYVTLAERQPDAKYAAAPAFAGKELKPFSFVFSPPGPEAPATDYSNWWSPVMGADWRHPQGPGSSIEDKGRHPVVQISWEDAVAYAAWAGKRLPTEAEWEFAARGGLDRKKYFWGDELKPGGRPMANYWQGRFPKENTMEDGFRGTAPVKSYPPNGFGLYDMAGNAWEWCSDWYRADYFAQSPRNNPQGPDSSLDPQEPGVKKRVQKGGSFLCADVYCARYLAGARHSGDIEGTADHIGFRCVRDPR